MGREQVATLAYLCILQVIFVFCTKLETGHLQDPGQRLWGLAPKTSLHSAAAGSINHFFTPCEFYRQLSFRKAVESESCYQRAITHLINL